MDGHPGVDGAAGGGAAAGAVLAETAVKVGEALRLRRIGEYVVFIGDECCV